MDPPPRDFCWHLDVELVFSRTVRNQWSYVLSQGSPTSGTLCLRIWGGADVIIIECNALKSSWNHPPAPAQWKNCLSWNLSLVPERLGTAVLSHQACCTWLQQPHVCVCVCVCVCVSHSIVSDSSTPWTVAQGILQARILKRVVISSSKGSSQPRDWTEVSCMAGGFFTVWATREALCMCAYMCIYIYVCVYIYVCIHTHTHTHTQRNIIYS